MALFSSPGAAGNIALPQLTYARNHEESVGLTVIKGTQSATFEDHFIGLDPSIEDLVKEFIKGVKGIPDNSSAGGDLSKLVKDYAPEILREARLKANDSNNFSNPDDRPLYWARIKMQVELKSHPYLLRNTGESRRLIDEFEGMSRGYSLMAFPAGSGDKKILIAGFDPFSLDINVSRINGRTVRAFRRGNIRQSNPSGAVALALHGTSVSDGANSGSIQSCIFPVRYHDFDAGVVEDFFKSYIDEKPVDEILTISQAVSETRIDIDRFPCRYRGGIYDNNNQGDGDNGRYFEQSSKLFPSQVQGRPFYETTLPVQAMLTAAINPKYTLSFNQTYLYKYNGRFQEHNDPVLPTGHQKLETPGLGIISPPNYVPTLHPDEDNLISLFGSGANYFSNEIFYRVCRLREQSSTPDLATGHLHIPKVQKESAGDNQKGDDFDASVTRDIILACKAIIEASLSGITK